MADQRASGGLPSGKALLAMAAATLVVVASVLVAVWSGSGASSGPQIPGSPMCTTAAEVGPTCTTTDPTGALDPAAVLPAARVSTVPTPVGVVVFAFGDAPFLGSAPGAAPGQPAVAVAAG